MAQLKEGTPLALWNNKQGLIPSIHPQTCSLLPELIQRGKMCEKYVKDRDTDYHYSDSMCLSW